MSIPQSQPTSGPVSPQNVALDLDVAHPFNDIGLPTCYSGQQQQNLQQSFSLMGTPSVSVRLNPGGSAPPASRDPNRDTAPTRVVAGGPAAAGTPDVGALTAPPRPSQPPAFSLGNPAVVALVGGDANGQRGATPVFFGSSIAASIVGSRPMTPNHFDQSRTTPMTFQHGATPAHRVPSPIMPSTPTHRGAPMSPANASANLLVTDLPPDCTHEKLRQHFARFGNVISVNVKSDLRGRQPGKGFVLFEHASSAMAARQAVHQTVFMGGRISVFTANQTSGAVPSRHLFVRFIPKEVQNDALLAFFASFGVVVSVRVRLQKATEAAQSQQWEFVEAVVDYGSPVPEQTREAIADCTAITDAKTGQTVTLSRPLVVKFDEPEKDRQTRNDQCGRPRSDSHASAPGSAVASSPTAQGNGMAPPAVSLPALPPQQFPQQQQQHHQIQQQPQSPPQQPPALSGARLRSDSAPPPVAVPVLVPLEHWLQMQVYIQPNTPPNSVYMPSGGQLVAFNNVHYMQLPSQQAFAQYTEYVRQQQQAQTLQTVQPPQAPYVLHHQPGAMPPPPPLHQQHQHQQASINLW